MNHMNATVSVNNPSFYGIDAAVRECILDSQDLDYLLASNGRLSLRKL